MKGSRTWFNYTPLSTTGTELKDDGSRVLCSIAVERGPDLPALELAIIGDSKKLEAIRIKTPETDGDLDEEERRIIGGITEHAMSMLQLLYDPGLGPQYLAGRHIKYGQFGADDGSPQLVVHAQEIRGAVDYDGDVIRNAIVATAPIRVQMSLFAEATRPTTPLPFKYLCYYKILELELRVKSKWIGLKDHLANYEGEYQQLAVGRASLINSLHLFRDRCAHIRTGGRDELGLIGMGSKDAERVAKFLPLLHKIVVDLLNKKHSGVIVLTPTLNNPATVSEPAPSLPQIKSSEIATKQPE